MKFETWEAIAQRHVRYREALQQRMAAWTRERIDSCGDAAELQQLVKLTERVERHETRMNRHMDRALAALPAGGVAN